ncbi:hypothetical protein ES705_41129 [subsurface metagenome]
MNQLVPLQAPLLVPQEQIQALMVQAQWFSSVMIGLAAASGVLILLPKIVGAVKEK